ncbi:MAG: pirin family protein [Fidelibacterota bacterium]|nr:MAG: pirin family protein [Candidatus Neomarinimicrobiota bacterium]
MSAVIRDVVRVERGMPTSDGAGVNLTRIIGTRQLLDIDPFLLLDEFKSDQADDYIAGFPPHPHRGFETVTYLLHGNFHHQDSRGNEGHLTAGSVQWMTAGRGIIHSEMPEMTEGLVWGFQLWLNLPAKDKLTEPRYQDIPPEQIPVFDNGGIKVKVITGEYAGLTGPAQTWIPALYLDVSLKPEQTFRQPVADHLTTLAYIIDGEARFGRPGEGGSNTRRELLIFGTGDEIQAETRDAEVRFLLLAAQPLNEPIVRGGPFVMNTHQELQQAFTDYQNGTLDR